MLLAYAALALLYPVANTFQALLLVSAVRGIASSFLWLSSWAYVFAYTDRAVKGKETGFFSEMNDLASALSPVVGGLVSIVSFYLPFYVLSLTSLTAFAIVTVLVKESPKPQSSPLKAQLRRLSAYMRSSRFMKTVVLIVIFYALINVYYSFISIFLSEEGVSVTLIGIVLTVALLPAVGLEVPTGNLMDHVGIRKTLLLATASTTITGLLLPLSNDIIYVFAVVMAFTVSYTAIFVALYSRMSDVMHEDKVAMTGAIATFKDLGYTVGPLAAGLLTQAVGIRNTFFIVGAAFALLLPMAARLHD